VVTLSQLCMNCAVAGQWGQAHTYALQAMTVRKSLNRAMILLDFSCQYETEALLRGEMKVSDNRSATTGGTSGAFSSLPHSLPCSRWRYFPRGRDTASKPSASYCEAAGWQQRWGCQQNSGRSRRRWERCMRQGASLHRRGLPGRRLRDHRGLAEGIKDEALRARFLTGPQIHPCCSTPKMRSSDFARSRGAERT